jgi:hypothetical protein
VTDGLQMSSTICGLILMWEVFSDFGESARRSIIPDKQNVDSTSYKSMLRPGVLLVSSTGSGTTSGIPLKGPDGKRWFMVAHHGFKVDDKVHHPRVNGSNTIVGRVQNDHRYTCFGSDIGLAKLEPGLTYSSVSFYREQVDGCNLGKLVNSEDLSIGELLFLDSAYNGRCEGMLGWRGVDVLDPVDPEYPDFCLSKHLYGIFWKRGR